MINGQAIGMDKPFIVVNSALLQGLDEEETRFILGHELGHAIIRQLNLPLTGLEEDSADGFATFFTVNDKDTGPNAAVGAAVRPAASENSWSSSAIWRWLPTP